MSAELQVVRLRKDFGTGRPAVDDVTFTIGAGEIVVLLGPSGCGKTTTLRCVAGLEHPTAGLISIGGELISDPARGLLVPPRARNFGMVFQSYAVWPHMTVRQNVAYPLRNRGFDRAKQDRMVADALELVSLAAYVDRPVTALSGGQMQRVALARSMVYHPRLLLLDEPLSNLDAQLRLRLRDDLRRIVKAAGLTALYVTHDQAEAVVLGDRIGVMRDGWIHEIRKGEHLRIVDLHGNQAVDTLFYNARNYADRYSAQDTIREQRNIYLTTGTRLMSNFGTTLLTITADTCGRHDTLGGACSNESNMVRYAIEKRHMHACRASFLKAVVNWPGLEKRDIPPNINFFMNVPVTPEGKLTFEDGISEPGKYVEMRAEIDVLCLISNCPQLNNPCNGYNPTPVEVLIWS